MDLRVIKTKRNIRDAFMELRREYSLDEIKVNMLCEKAMINKTTFYNHYQDIYHLSEELETEVLNDFISNFTDVDMMLTDANRFINGMHSALKVENGMLRVLFDGKLDELIERTEIKIRKFYAKEDQMLVSFLMGGMIHLMMKDDMKMDELESFLIEVIGKIHYTYESL